jgi:hypothetical protein
MTLAKHSSQKNIRVRTRSAFEAFMAILVLLNYLLVIFDATYIPLRDFWLQGRFQVTLLRFNEPIKLGPIAFQELQFPLRDPWEFPFVTVVSQYDTVKGIKPYRATVEYLQTVDNLEKAIQSDRTPAERKEVDDLLEELRQDSTTIIETNPFQIANKTGTLEKISGVENI